MDAKDFILIYCTTPNKKVSKNLAKHLLSLKLIACANVLPEINSFYEWKENFKEEQESLLICKTQKSLYQLVEKEIKKEHPYECPCITALSFTKANPDFLKWIHNQNSKA